MKTEAALTAKAIRTELKKAFPGIKFTVKSETYSGGDNVNISYTDGVKAEKIEKIVKKYQMGKFNGMEDYYDMTNRRADIPQVKYVFVNRDMSEATKATIAKKYENHVFDEYYGLEKRIRLDFQSMEIK